MPRFSPSLHLQGKLRLGATLFLGVRLSKGCGHHAGYTVPVYLPLPVSPASDYSIQLASGTRVGSHAYWMPGAHIQPFQHTLHPKPLYWLWAVVPPCTTLVIVSADPQLCSASRPPILPLSPPLSLTNHHHPLFLCSLIPLGSATSNFPMARALGGTPSANCRGRKAVCLSPGGREF